MRRNATIRFAEAERTAIRRAARLAGTGWTTFARKAALSRANEVLGVHVQSPAQSRAAVESGHVVEIAVEFGDIKHQFFVPASRFLGMRWVTEELEAEDLFV